MTIGLLIFFQKYFLYPSG
ncbi:hypothetical protein CFP56_024233 [Quercus suber]|uniref:Uncharacterized protein n=1 Tax=Quercus suber TaxID=58331 RepID=A0AAW0MH98_QUESU